MRGEEEKQWWERKEMKREGGEEREKGNERGVQEKNERKKMKRKKRGVEMCTVDPADGQRLEDGEKQQAGSTAGEMVVDLEHIEPTLHRGGNSIILYH